MNETTEETPIEVSILLVSFNTRDLTRECLTSVLAECKGMSAEVLVMDNASKDGSYDMIAAEFPQVRLFRSDCNLGFGGANNVILREAAGRYLVLLNTDAFFAEGALRLAIDHMDAHPRCGLGGGRLVGRDGHWQPSARTFHSITTDASVLTGLSTRYPRSRVFGRMDRTWTDQMQPAKVDWVPGAFSILRPETIAEVGTFDPAFFLYYEEVDLCRRIVAAGWEIWYWPDIVITHIGGESSRSLKSLDFNSTASQVVKWRMRSTFLYYRKHHGTKAVLAKWLEQWLYTASAWRNRFSNAPRRKARERYFQQQKQLLKQAWADTRGGRTSPPRPW